MSWYEIGSRDRTAPPQQQLLVFIMLQMMNLHTIQTVLSRSARLVSRKFFAFFGIVVVWYGLSYNCSLRTARKEKSLASAAHYAQSAEQQD
jgi:uncharacterized membrane protein